MQRPRTVACTIVALFCLCQGTRAQGRVSAWGFNYNGQLGNGTYSTIPRYGIYTAGTVSGLVARAIAGGYNYSLALKGGGTVWSWGGNPYGELGDGTNTTSDTPVQVSGLSGVATIAGGYFHSLALKSDGTVWTWGYNSFGELGNGTYRNSNTPVQVSGLSGVMAIAGGGFHSLALKSDGTVWAWGNNGEAELGNGTYTTIAPYGSAKPVQVLGPGGVGYLTGVTAIAAGGDHSLALKSDGTVWAWGNNGEGELGNGTNATSSAPVQVLGSGGEGYLAGVTAIAAGGFHSLALKGDGTVWAWGLNYSGQLGNGRNTASNTPVQVNWISGVTAVAGGVLHSLALTTDGMVWAWGYNSFGELGNETYQDSNTPVQVSELSGVTAIAGGYYHSLALKGITSFIQQVLSLEFSNGAQTGLAATLQAAQGYLQAGDTTNAIAELQAFIGEINVLVDNGWLNAAASGPLISAAGDIIAAL